MAGTIRVLVADCERLRSDLLIEKLSQEPTFETSATDPSPESFTECVSSFHPDVVLVGVEGLETSAVAFAMLRDAHAASPGLKSIMLLRAPTSELIREAFFAGAAGVVTSSDAGETLVNSIHCVHNGRIWVRDDQISCFLELLDQKSATMNSSISGLLTRRQMDLVKCVAEGKSNREIAKELSLSEFTVRNYLFRIFRKCGVSTRSELVLFHYAPRAEGLSSSGIQTGA